MGSLAERIESVRRRIETAARCCGRRPEEISLIAVSKTVPSNLIASAVEKGIHIFGENYIQEALEKIEKVKDSEITDKTPVTWHFIGHLQTNKAKYAVRHFDLIHSVDSEKLAREIDKQAARYKKRQRILIQVNIAEEETKSGISGAKVLELVQTVGRLENVAVEGLMTMPPFFDDPERARPFFRALSEIREQIQNADIANVNARELSMGMTGDFETAIEEGATMVRIGTALFGKRK